VPALVSLLREDAAFAMPPLRTWFRGREAIRAFLSAVLLAGDVRGRYRMLLMELNGAPGFACYELDPATGTHRPRAVQVLELEGDGENARVAGIVSFLDPSLPELLGLPVSVTV
jgi:RNA polymerase sigma-70 factor (ECF subfamily)